MLGAASWWFFVASYNLSCTLFNERTINELINSLDEGTLSKLEGLIEDEDNDEEG